MQQFSSASVAPSTNLLAVLENGQASHQQAKLMPLFFHPLQEAESLLREDGEFLIRDSRSSPGDYVLSCFWSGQTLHFKIIRVVLRPRKGYSRTLFQFEQEQFDNVPALVCFYVGNRKAISDVSGAVVSQPVNRSVPLRWLKERYDNTHQPPEAAKRDAAAPTRRFSFRLPTTGEEMAEGNLLR